MDFIFCTNRGGVCCEDLAEELAGDEDIQQRYLAV
jgi:hypothetical protein